jgi:hypothetical protein
MIDISIIIVNWNSKFYLYNCIKSIINKNSVLKKEIIVVDNASGDESVELVKRDFPNVTVIMNETNYGFSKANNIGIKHSQGKYVFIINPDVEIVNNCINILYQFMEKNQNIGILGPKIISNNGITQRSYMGLPTLWNTFCRSLALDRLFPRFKLFGGLMMTYRKINSTSNVDVINGCFWVVRREAIHDVGLLDERFFMYGEDIDWCKRFHDNDWEVVYFPYAEAIHFGGGSSSNAPTRFYIEMQNANLQYYDKYCGKLRKRIYHVILLMYQFVRIVINLLFYMFSVKERGLYKEKVKKYYKCLSWLIFQEHKYSTIVCQ